MPPTSTSLRMPTWWNRPAGGREVLQVALPLVISSLSWTIMTFVDRVFLKWVSGEAMSAAFSASMVWFSLLCLPLGICTYANTFVSQYYGDRQWNRIGAAVWQTIWLALAVAPMILLFIPLAPKIFELSGHPPAVTALEVRYFQVLCWGAGGMLVSQAASAFYGGRGNTVVMMWVDGFYAVVNLILDYLWIFGYLGFPAMGIAGAGYATNVALWLKASTYVALMIQPKYRDLYGTIRGIPIDRALLCRILYYGVPSGLQMLLDVIGFTVFVLMIGRLGRLEAEATSMAFSVSTLAFMPIWGFGLAAGILVGQRLGEDDPDLAERSTWTTVTIGMAYMAVISFLYLAVPDLFLWSFFAGSDSATDDRTAVRALSVQLLRFVAAYNLLDAMLTIFVNAIKGAGDTRFVLQVSCLMGLLLAVVSYLAVEVWHLQIYGCWVIVTGWIWLMGVIYYLRFRHGAWRDMRVIEQQHLAHQT